MGVKFPHPAKNKERLKTARDGTKARNSDPLVSLPVQIQKRQQENGPQSTTKSPTPDTKRLKTDPNGSKIKKVPFHPSPSGRGAGGEVVSLPWAGEDRYINYLTCDLPAPVESTRCSPEGRKLALNLVVNLTVLPAKAGTSTTGIQDSTFSAKL